MMSTKDHKIDKLECDNAELRRRLDTAEMEAKNNASRARKYELWADDKLKEAEYYAQKFVREAEEVKYLRKLLDEKMGS